MSKEHHCGTHQVFDIMQTRYLYDLYRVEYQIVKS